MARTTPSGFVIVTATWSEREAFRITHPDRGKPSCNRVRCPACGLRFWGSGLAIGAHSRTCQGDWKNKPFLTQDKEQQPCP